jgi:hypothetical protein
MMYHNEELIMRNLNKKIAFTLVEVLIVLVIVGFIAWPFIQAAKKGTRHYTNSLLSYSALDSLTNAAYDMANNPGCTASDMAASGGLHPYCPGTTGSISTGVIPWYLSTAADASTPIRGFCDRLANEELNVVGTNICSAPVAVTDASNFNSITPTFTASNGMRFFFPQSSTPNPSAKTAAGIYTLYVDIDGPRRSGRYTESAAGQKDVDVIKFLISMDGNTVVPDASGIAANDVDYLTASVSYKNGTNDVNVLTGVPFRQAYCAVNTNPFPKVDPTTVYCSAHGSYAAVVQNVTCATQTCTATYVKPQMLGN